MSNNLLENYTYKIIKIINKTYESGYFQCPRCKLSSGKTSYVFEVIPVTITKYNTEGTFGSISVFTRDTSYIGINHLYGYYKDANTQTIFELVCISCKYRNNSFVTEKDRIIELIRLVI